MPKPTLRLVAASCGISAATVSRALSGHPNVRGAVRERVRQAAERVGYARNHLVGTLMAHVRAARTHRFLGNIAMVHVPSVEQPQPLPMQEIMIEAAEARARELGFQLRRHELTPGPAAAAVIGRVLRARGVLGAVFLYSRPTDATAGFPWEYFATVEIDYGAPRPVQDTVAIDHYVTLTDALTRLHGLGYRRVGLFIERYKDERLMYKWSAAFRSFQEMHGGIGTAPVLMVSQMTAAPFLAWQRQHGLDLVLGHVDQAITWLRGEGRQVPRDVGFFNLNWNERSRPCAGLDLRPELQGIVAVESLVAQIHRNERGLPADPHTVMLSGRWVDGPTVSPRRKAGRPG
jgi:LacI family transcriptional regulator